MQFIYKVVKKAPTLTKVGAFVCLFFGIIKEKGRESMTLLKCEENNTHILRDYKLKDIRTRENALYCVACMSKNPDILIKRIEVDDFLSFTDGSISKSILEISDINSFVNQYKESSVESVSILGTYKKKPFVLSIGLDSVMIGLSYRKRKMVDYQSLEQLLELIG